MFFVHVFLHVLWQVPDLAMVALHLVFELDVFVDAGLAEDLPAVRTRLRGRGGGRGMVTSVYAR